MQKFRDKLAILVTAVGATSACSTVLGIDYPPLRPGVTDGSIDAIDGGVSLEAGANAGFCATQPGGPRTYCSDFDEHPYLQPPFAFAEQRIASAAIAESLEAPSQPKALLVTVPSAPAGPARAFVEIVLDAPASSIRCELRWKLDGPPPATSMDAAAFDPMDLVAFELADATGITQVIGLVQQANLDVALFNFGTTRRVGGPTTGWSRISVDFHLADQQTRVTLNGGAETVFATAVLSPPTSIRVAVGAYSVTSGPWRVYYDDLYCKSS